MNSSSNERMTAMDFRLWQSCLVTLVWLFNHGVNGASLSLHIIQHYTILSQPLLHAIHTCSICNVQLRFWNIVGKLPQWDITPTWIAHKWTMANGSWRSLEMVLQQYLCRDCSTVVLYEEKGVLIGCSGCWDVLELVDTICSIRESVGIRCKDGTATNSWAILNMVVSLKQSSNQTRTDPRCIYAYKVGVRG